VSTIAWIVARAPGFVDLLIVEVGSLGTHVRMYVPV
jgi:hypothetical protein